MSTESGVLSILREYLDDGWRPFSGTIEKEFLQTTLCQGGNADAAPFWIYRGDIYLCLGCSQACAADRPACFNHTETILYPHKAFSLTPLEMASTKHTLRVDEAAYCLNCSEAKIYKNIYEGKLITLKEKPVRIRANDILEMMNDFDE